MDVKSQNLPDFFVRVTGSERSFKVSLPVWAKHQTNMAAPDGAGLDGSTTKHLVLPNGDVYLGEVRIPLPNPFSLRIRPPRLFAPARTLPHVHVVLRAGYGCQIDPPELVVSLQHWVPDYALE